MMVDTSAILAILLNEPERRHFIDRIETAERPFATPATVFETALGLSATIAMSPADAYEAVSTFLATAGVKIHAFVPPMAALAIEGYDKFGKGRHAAALNWGDCLSYGAARYFRATLLFKGDDFSETDIDERARRGG